MSVVAEIILLCQKSDVGQAVYLRGFNVMKAYGDVVVKCNILVNICTTRSVCVLGNSCLGSRLWLPRTEYRGVVSRLVIQGFLPHADYGSWRV
jgi:hypothetical protein